MDLVCRGRPTPRTGAPGALYAGSAARFAIVAIVATLAAGCDAGSLGPTSGADAPAAETSGAHAPADTLTRDPETALRDPTLAPEPLRAELTTLLDRARAATGGDRYEIEATFDDDRRLLTGRVRITAANRAEVPVQRLPVRLYWNAFANDGTLWARGGESPMTPVSPAQHAEHTEQADHADRGDPHGYMRLLHARQVSPDATHDVTVGWPGVEEGDATVAQLALPTPWRPGEVRVLELEFEARVPAPIARVGAIDGFALVSHWFPKLAVMEPEGPHAQPFTHHSEFYADFADYAVTLTVPADLTIASTGIERSSRAQGSTRVVQLEAASVHDFAWVAGRELAFDEATVDGVRLRIVSAEDQRGLAKMHLEAAAFTLAQMQRLYGAYPWSTLTVVAPPAGAEEVEGMEYPTLVTTSRGEPHTVVPGDLAHAYRGTPRLWRARPEGFFTTIHEIGHQWFQGLLASDEHRWPHLDEGFNTLSNALVVEALPEPDRALYSLLGHTASARDTIRLANVSEQRAVHPIDSASDLFGAGVGGYGTTVYRRTGAALLSLRETVGAEAFDAAMRGYTTNAAFTHPTPSTFVEALRAAFPSPVRLGIDGPKRAVALDVPAAYERLLHADTAANVRVDAVGTLEHGTRGFALEDVTAAVGDAGAPHAVAPQAGASHTTGYVRLARDAGPCLPVDVELTLQRGDEAAVTYAYVWDAQAAWVQWNFADYAVRRVRLDPARKLVHERDWLDNAWVDASWSGEASHVADPATGELAGELASELAGESAGELADVLADVQRALLQAVLAGGAP